MIPVDTVPIEPRDQDREAFAACATLMAFVRQAEPDEGCLLDARGLPVHEPPLVLIVRLEGDRLIRLAVNDVPLAEEARRLVDRVRTHFASH